MANPENILNIARDKSTVTVVSDPPKSNFFMLKPD